MITTVSLHDAGTTLAALIASADNQAEQILLCYGAASEEHSGIHHAISVLDEPATTILEEARQIRADRALVDAFFAPFEFKQRDPVESALAAIGAHREMVAYALGVAVGVRLAGGIR